MHAFLRSTPWLILLPAFALAAQAQTSQRQYQLRKTGDGAAALTLTETQVRQPGDHEVQVRVRAVSLNRRDVYLKLGQYPGPQRPNLVPLSDGAGEVTAVGAKVKRFREGDRVAATFFQEWVDGRPNGATADSALGGALDGMLSEHVTLHENGLVKLPSYLSYEEAATLPCAGVTAWNGLVTRALIGGLSSFGGEIPSFALMGRNATASGIYVGSRADFEALLAFLDKHRIKPVIDRVFEFKDAAAAFDYMDSGQLFGKVVLRL